MPVLPLVASITVCPGLSLPVRSASSMTPSARRSFTEPMGLNASIFTNSRTCLGASFVILTTGVRPMVPRMSSYLGMDAPVSRSSGTLRRGSNQTRDLRLTGQASPDDDSERDQAQSVPPSPAIPLPPASRPQRAVVRHVAERLAPCEAPDIVRDHLHDL